MTDFRNLRIVFMGTPDFAVASLEALVNAGCQVVAVVTAPDKPAGRGLQLKQSAIKQYALAHNLPVLQPEKLKSPIFLDELRELKADLQVVVAFRMLPEVVWNMPPMGTINLHGSLLPQYRGAAPINWAIINGETTTGVTTFKLRHEIDTGNIILQQAIPIGEHENAGELHDKMKEVGAGLLVETVKQFASGTLNEIVQSNLTEIKHAPKLFAADCQIDFTKNLTAVYNLIRGLSPFPGAYTHINGKTLKIFQGEKELTIPKEQSGEWVTDGKTFLKFACADGYLRATDLQLEGKKRMAVQEFLKGFRQ